MDEPRSCYDETLAETEHLGILKKELVKTVTQPVKTEPDKYIDYIQTSPGVFIRKDKNFDKEVAENLKRIDAEGFGTAKYNGTGDVDAYLRRKYLEEKDAEDLKAYFKNQEECIHPISHRRQGCQRDSTTGKWIVGPICQDCDLMIHTKFGI